MVKGKREQGKVKREREYSKISVTCIVATFCPLAVGFVVFVCYEMHRLCDLSPVAYLAPSIIGLLASVMAFYMWRAKAKDKTDLEWEQTKRLTQLKDKYPTAFTRGTEETTIDNEGGNG